MDKQITKVTVAFMAVPKGKRKEVRLSHELAKLEGHKTLTPDEINLYERQFWQFIDLSDYKQKPTNANLCVNFGKEDDVMVFVQIFPKQSQLLAR